MTSTEFPRVIWEFVAASNACDSQWLSSLFTNECSVSACGYTARGLSAISDWVDAEVVGPAISFCIDEVSCNGTSTLLMVKATDHGLTHRCSFEFVTEGRYIASLVITSLPEATAIWTSMSAAE